MASDNPMGDAAEFGIKAIVGIGQGVLADAQINAANIVNEANAWSNNLVRAANNRLSGARASLARYTQSVNNQRVMDNAGSAAEAAMVNYRRSRDSALNDDIESQIAFAEQAGAQTASAALSGLSGGVADIVNGTTALRKSRIQQRTADALKQADYDASRQAAFIMEAGWDSMDSSDIVADLDLSTDVAVKKSRGGNLLFDIFGGQDSTTMANLTSQGYKFFKSTPSNRDVTIPMQPGGGY